MNLAEQIRAEAEELVERCDSINTMHSDQRRESKAAMIASMTALAEKWEAENDLFSQGEALRATIAAQARTIERLEAMYREQRENAYVPIIARSSVDAAEADSRNSRKRERYASETEANIQRAKEQT